MPMESRHRLEGLLLNSKRGLMLQMDDGGVWALDHDRAVSKLVGLRVVVEGARSGFDRIDVDWIGKPKSFSLMSLRSTVCRNGPTSRRSARESRAPKAATH
jgi:hypothetical protein